MNSEYMSIFSEIRELELLLESIPDENVIERMSLEVRLKSSREALETFSQKSIAPKARLTFRGRPVTGSYGMSADFAAKAAGAFSDAFSAIAASLNTGLRHIGPIPNKSKHQLMITGTAIGSFGFEFELPISEPTLFPQLDQANDAMNKVETLLRLAAEGSDDEVAEVIEEVHPRAVKKVYDFLDVLVQQQAWCGLEYANRVFRYADFNQIKASLARLKDDNIKKTDETYHGEFQGILPMGRTFEFSLSDQEGLIRGKVDIAIEDPDILNRQWLHHPVAVKFTVMQVGQGKPRYTLMSIEDISDNIQ